MKIIVYVIAIAMFMTGTICLGSISESKKINNTNGKVIDSRNELIKANQEINQAIKDSIKQYKKEAELKIKSYEKDIADLKVKISKQKKEDKAKYEKKLAMLEKKNKELKKNLEEFKESENEKWVAFRNKFSHDMDDLGKALKEFFE